MNNIKKYRLENGFDLKKLADKSNISIGYLCHLEKGTRQNPSIKVMKNMSRALNKEVSDIFDL